MNVESSGSNTLRALRPSRFQLPYRGLLVMLIALMAVLGGYFITLHTHRQPAGLPKSITKQITNFRIYYPGQFARSFTLQPDASYGAGVLVFSMKDIASKTLVFTEQATPANYDPTFLKTDTQFNTEYGQAYITDATDRTTGALFTTDGTWVVINAPSPVGDTVMREALDALTLVKP